MSSRAAQPRPYLALLLGVACIGMSAIFTKWASVPGAANGFWRMSLAGVLMLPLFLRDARRQPLRSGRGVWLAVLAGLFFAADIFAWGTGLQLSNVATTTFLANTAPVWVGLGALLIFRQRLRQGFWLGLLVALTGAAVLLGRDLLAGANAGLGSTLGLIAGFFYGGYVLITQKVRERLSILASFWIATMASAAALLLCALFLGQPLLGYPAASYVNLLLVALISQVGGYVLVNYSLGHLPASIVAPTLMIQPAFTALIGVPLLGERLTLIQIGGFALVSLGVWVVNKHGR
jgi:drug/metabolite transporter (DMT)-like permease